MLVAAVWLDSQSLFLLQRTSRGREHKEKQRATERRLQLQYK